MDGHSTIPFNVETQTMIGGRCITTWLIHFLAKSECECALCLHRALHGHGSAFLVMDGAEVSVLGREYSQMS